MWNYLYVLAVLVSANLAASAEVSNARSFWVQQQAGAQDLFAFLSKQVLQSKQEQITNAIKYAFFNNQQDLLDDFNARLDAAEDITDKLTLMNNSTNSELFLVSNESVSIQPEALKSLIEGAAYSIFDREFPSQNKSAVLASLSQKLDQGIAEISERLQTVTLESLKQSASGHSLGRSRRDVVSVISSIFRSIINLALTQVQLLFDAFMQNITTAVTNLYIGDSQTNLILSTVTTYANQVILQIVQLLVNIQQWGDTLINSIITQSSRRRRDITPFDMYWDLESPTVDLVNCRSKRDIFSTIGAGLANLFQLIVNAFSPLIAFLNSTLKNVFVSYLTLQYTAVGTFILYPVRLLFEIIVDTILPCTTCGSIV